MENNRDNPASSKGNNPQQASGDPHQEAERINQENPQDGAQWDNYRARSLSSEGGEKIEQDDLLNADEAKRQDTGNTSGNQK